METSDRKKTDILIVDDTPENLKVLRSILMQQSYRVRVAINGQMAINSVAESLPDLILLDIRMPGIDGFEVCRRLKADALFQQIPVIFLSASDDLDDKIRAFSSGGVDYVTKPFQVEEVLARVTMHLKTRELQKALEEKNADLETALASIKTLSGLLPICAQCKKIRDDQGYWNRIEKYISEHTDVSFSHGLCPECMEHLYGGQEWYEKAKRQKAI